MDYQARLMRLGASPLWAECFAGQLALTSFSAKQLVRVGQSPAEAEELVRQMSVTLPNPPKLAALGMNPRLAEEIALQWEHRMGLTDFDFRQGPLSPLFTFTRSGKSWRTVNGVLREYDVDEPCLTGDGWSVRPAETNLVWPSVPANGSWSPSEATMPSGDTITAAGYTLQRIQANASPTTPATRGITRPGIMSVNPGETALIMAAVKPNSGNGYFQLGFTGFTTWEGTNSVIFNLHTGTSSWAGSSGVAKGMQLLADGVWLCWTALKKKSDAVDTILTPSISVHPENVASEGTEYLYVGGIYVVKGVSNPIPYIPTTDSAVTRPADSASIQGDAFASIWNPMEGAIVLDASLAWIDQFPRFLQLGGSGTEFSVLMASNESLYTYSNSITTTIDPSNWSGAPIKIGFSWSSGKVSLWLNGFKKITDLSSASDFSTFTQMLIGQATVANYKGAFQGRRLTIFNRRPSDAQMEALTS